MVLFQMSREGTCRYWENLLGTSLRYPRMNLVDISSSKRMSQTRPKLVPVEILAVQPGQLFSTGTQYADQVRLRCAAKSATAMTHHAEACSWLLLSTGLMRSAGRFVAAMLECKRQHSGQQVCVEILRPHRWARLHLWDCGSPGSPVLQR